MARRSALMLAGMVRITRYPITAAMAARPMPVLPEVGSITVPPRFSAPLCSACRSISSATRSLALPAGLQRSSLASSVACKPRAFP